MEITNLKLKQLVFKTYSMIVNHIYNYGDAHKLATSDQNGFLDKNDKVKLDYWCNYARNTGSNVDILTLKPGIYAARNWINSPISGDEVLLVEVVRGVSPDDGCVIFRATDTSRGDLYVRTVYLAGDRDSGWKKVNITTV